MKSFFTAAALAASVALSSAQTCGGPDFPTDAINLVSDAGNCGTDPNDGSDFEILLQACPGEVETLVASLTFTGTDNIVTTTAASSALTSVASPTDVTLSFPGVANTAFSSGGLLVTSITLDNGATGTAAANAFDPFTETYSPVTSIFFAAATTTVTTLITDSTTTTTIMATSTVTSTVSQATVTQSSDCSTGTATLTSYINHTTKRTVTPKPRTKTSLVVKHTTIHLSCIPRPTGHRRRNVIVERQNGQGVNQGAFEPLFCPSASGAPVSTTFTTSTAVTTETAATAFVSTVVGSTTVTTTVSSAAATTTVCHTGMTTVTVHPTRTGTFITILPQKTTTTTHIKTVTRTVYPLHPHLCPTHNTNAIKTATKGAVVASPY